MSFSVSPVSGCQSRIQSSVMRSYYNQGRVTVSLPKGYDRVEGLAEKQSLFDSWLSSSTVLYCRKESYYLKVERVEGKGGARKFIVPNYRGFGKPFLAISVERAELYSRPVRFESVVVAPVERRVLVESISDDARRVEVVDRVQVENPVLQSVGEQMVSPIDFEALIDAACVGDERRMELLCLGLSVEEKHRVLTQEHSVGSSLLMWAARCGQVLSMEWICSQLSEGEKHQVLTREDSEGRTLLMLAAMYGKVSGMEWICSQLSEGEKYQVLTYENSKGVTPLMMAESYWKIESMEWIFSQLSEGEKRQALTQEDSVGDTLLMLAARYGQVSSVEWICSQLSDNDMGQLVNRRNVNGETALDLAIRYEDLSKVKLLLMVGADVYANSPCQKSALSLASKARKVEIQKAVSVFPELVRAIADILDLNKRQDGQVLDLERQLSQGETVLSYVAREGYVDLLEVLVRDRFGRIRREVDRECIKRVMEENPTLSEGVKAVLSSEEFGSGRGVSGMSYRALFREWYILGGDALRDPYEVFVQRHRLGAN